MWVCSELITFNPKSFFNPPSNPGTMKEECVWLLTVQLLIGYDFPAGIMWNTNWPYLLSNRMCGPALKISIVHFCSRYVFENAICAIYTKTWYDIFLLGMNWKKYGFDSRLILFGLFWHFALPYLRLLPIRITKNLFKFQIFNLITQNILQNAHSFLMYNSKCFLLYLHLNKFSFKSSIKFHTFYWKANLIWNPFSFSVVNMRSIMAGIRPCDTLVADYNTRADVMQKRYSLEMFVLWFKNLREFLL